MLTDKDGSVRKIVLEIKFSTIRLHPPVDKKKHYPELLLTAIEAKEPKISGDKKSIIWKLLTNLPVRSLAEAIEKLQWYAMRWKIETFHKILKSGCRAEESRLRTAERLVNLMAIFCILSWRIFWITMLHRTAPDVSPSCAFTDSELLLLRQLPRKKNTHTVKHRALSFYILQIAKLGGYLARANDPPPGNIVIWRGLARLSDIQLGSNLT